MHKPNRTEDSTPGAEYAAPYSEPLTEKHRKRKRILSTAALIACVSCGLLVAVSLNSQQGGVIPTPPTPALPDSGTIQITYYNETFEPDLSKHYDRIVEVQTYVLPGFESALLPEPEPAEGYTFAVWVLYSEGSGENAVFLVLDKKITASQLAYIAPDENGLIDVSVYAVWLPSDDTWGVNLTLDANGGQFAGGAGQLYVHPSGPLASAAKYFVEVLYAAPVRAGFTFDGWYAEPDCSGERIYALYAENFFALTEDGHVDWTKELLVKLYAKWS